MEEEPPTPPTPAPPSSPFWLQSSTTSHYRLRRPSSLLLNTGFQVAVLSLSAIVLLAAATPSLISLTQHVFRPSAVKRGWDSLNLVLVLFAVVCGFLGRKDGEDQQSNGDTPVVRTPQSGRSTEQYNWLNGGYDGATRVQYGFGNQGQVAQLRRNYSSYPDLRQEMLWEVECDRRMRSYDDSFVDNCKSPRLMRFVESFRSRQIDGDKVEKDDSDVKDIEVDTLRTRTQKESPSPPPENMPPTPPKLPASTPEPPAADPSRRDRKASRQEYESIGRRVRRDGQRRRELGATKIQSPSPVRTRTPPPQPPPPVTVVGEESSEGSGSRSHKKRGGVSKEIISSIYNQSKKKKKQKRRSHENLEELVYSPNPTLRFTPPSPPPPPPPLPPPPSSIFNNIFSTKKGKSGKKSSIAPPPPPPPPPPRSSTSHSISHPIKIKTKLTTKSSTKPTNHTNFDLIERTGNGSESPLIPIPPPPPPPPFKMPSWKFVVEGDYVKIISSPQRSFSESESEASATSTPVAAGNTPSPLFCPSPDVNIKADDFIARFRAKLKLEKMNSLKQKQGMGIGSSPLNPDSCPSPN